jgi:hypothetical protein
MVKHIQKVPFIYGSRHPHFVNVLRRWNIRPIQFLRILLYVIARVAAC